MAKFASGLKVVLQLNVLTVCRECRTTVHGSVSLDHQLRVIDSEGFLIAGADENSSVVCDDCCDALFGKEHRQMVTPPLTREQSRRLAEVHLAVFAYTPKK